MLLCEQLLLVYLHLQSLFIMQVFMTNDITVYELSTTLLSYKLYGFLISFYTKFNKIMDKIF